MTRAKQAFVRLVWRSATCNYIALNFKNI